VAHAGHQVLDARATGRREGVAGMAEVVEVHSFGADRADRVWPAGQFAEIAAPQRGAAQAAEDQRAGLRADELGQVLFERRVIA
jgi:hypothetical protein